MDNNNVINLNKWKRKRNYKKFLAVADVLALDCIFVAIAFLGASVIFFILAVSMLMVSPIWLIKRLIPQMLDPYIKPVAPIVKLVNIKN
jgi:hypothetical protein